MESRIWKVIAFVAALHILVLVSFFVINHGCKQTPKEPGVARAEPNPYMPTAPPPAPTPGSVDTTVVVPPPGAPATPVVAPSTPVVAPPTPAVAETYVIKKGDTLGAIAKAEGVNLNDLMAANPGIDPKRLRIGQEIHIPAAGGHAPEAAGAAIAGAAPPSGTVPVASGTYTVKKGDTLGKIARAQGTTVAALKKTNKLTNDTIRVGQKLKIPTPTESGQRPPRESTMAKSGASTDIGSALTHTVEPGETPDTIAKRYGITSKALLAANGNLNPRRLKIGQKLVIPGKAGEAAPAGEVPTEAVPALAPPMETAPTDTGVSGTAVPPTTPAETPATVPAGGSGR